MKKCFPILLALFLWVGNDAKAQVLNGTCSVSGKITGKAGESLEFVTVSLRRLPDTAVLKTVISNSGGIFLFKNVPPGEYMVSASLVGFQKTTGVPFKTGTDCSTPADAGTIVMNEIPKDIGGVVLTSRRPTIRRKLDKTILNIENSILAGGSTAFDVLQMAPGVTVGNDDNIELFGKGGPLIMLDGKPSYLSKEQLINWLKSLSSDMISEIEIISQPSAKYDAAGISGIINIKTKRVKTTGFKGTYTGAFGYGRRDKYRSSVNLGYKADKFAVTSDYSFGYNHTIRYLDIDRYVNTPNGPAMFDRSGDFNDQIKSHNYKTTFTWFINKNNSLGAQLIGYNNRQHPSGTYNFTGVYDGLGKLDSSVVSASTQKSAFKSLGGNLNYASKLDTLGRELSMDVDYSRFVNSTYRVFSNTLYDKAGIQQGQPHTIRNNFPTNIDVFTAKTDLVYPLKKNGTIETGLKTSIVTTDNNATFDSLINDIWKPSVTQSNYFIYRENINAAYISGSREFKGFSMQAGLRVEQTNSDAESVTLASRTKRSYTSLFPSLFMAREFKNNNRVSFSYSRRIERPNYQNLNPFRFYDDRYTYHEGNPFLKPAYTNSYELNSSFKNIYAVTLQYSTTTDVFAEDIQQKEENGLIVTWSYYRNYATARDLTATFSYSKDVTSWWSTDNAITFRRSQVIDNSDGLSRNLSNYNVGFNMYQFFQLSKTVSAELSGFYRTSSLYGFIRQDPRYKLDAGVRKNLWNKKASIRFKLSDIFNTNRFQGKAVYGDVDVRILNRFESRTFFVTFNYNFGNNKVKVSRRTEGNTDVKDRIQKEN